MRVEFLGVTPSPGLPARIERRLARELARIGRAPLRVVVTFADDNGPKGGPAMRCALTVRIPRRPAVRVEEVAETAWLAFDRSFGRLKRRLADFREERLKRARRPKKYYAARRVLGG